MPSMPCHWCKIVKRCTIQRTTKGTEYLCPRCLEDLIELRERGLQPPSQEER